MLENSEQSVGLVKSWGTLMVLPYIMCDDVIGHVCVERTGDRLPLVWNARDSVTGRGIARILILPLINEEEGVLMKNWASMALVDLRS